MGLRGALRRAAMRVETCINIRKKMWDEGKSYRSIRQTVTDIIRGSMDFEIAVQRGDLPAMQSFIGSSSTPSLNFERALNLFDDITHNWPVTPSRYESLQFVLRQVIQEKSSELKH